jgi:hypothetical protein
VQSKERRREVVEWVWEKYSCELKRDEGRREVVHWLIEVVTEGEVGDWVGWKSLNAISLDALRLKNG